MQCSTYRCSWGGWSICRSCTTGSGCFWKCSTLETKCTSARASEGAGVSRPRPLSTLWTSKEASRRCGFYSPWPSPFASSPTSVSAAESTSPISDLHMIFYSCFSSPLLDLHPSYILYCIYSLYQLRIINEGANVPVLKLFKW